MNAYIDCSGDPGILGSKYFVSALVYFHHNEAGAEAECVKAIDELKGELSLRPDHEFKWSKDPDTIKELFFDKIKNLRFEFVTFIARKDTSGHTNVGVAGSNLVKLALTSVLASARQRIPYINIVMDEDVSNKLLPLWKRYFNQFLWRKIGDRAIDDFGLEQSHFHNCLQLADYLAGLRRWFHFPRNVNEKVFADKYSKIIAHLHKEESSWNL